MVRPELIDVNVANLHSLGFFCLMSKPEALGYRKKLEWIQARFAEGLRLKMIGKGGRGFIEYIPGEYAWRPVEAAGYMVIHCLWVVGKAQGQGCGAALIDACIGDAWELGMHGVAAVTGHRATGLADTAYFLKRGFRIVETAPPGLDLVVRKFDHAPDPRFAGDWERKRGQAGADLTAFHCAQCPYIPQHAEKVVELAARNGIPARAVELRTAAEVRSLAPSAYGVYDIVWDGKLLRRRYHGVSIEKLRKDFCR